MLAPPEDLVFCDWLEIDIEAKEVWRELDSLVPFLDAQTLALATVAGVDVWFLNSKVFWRTFSRLCFIEVVCSGCKTGGDWFSKIFKTVSLLRFLSPTFKVSVEKQELVAQVSQMAQKVVTWPFLAAIWRAVLPPVVVCAFISTEVLTNR